jgi:hypothetical protein
MADLVITAAAMRKWLKEAMDAMDSAPGQMRAI